MQKTKPTTLTIHLRNGQPPVDDAGKQWAGAYTFNGSKTRKGSCNSCWALNYKKSDTKLCESCTWAARSCSLCGTSLDGIPIYIKERTRKGVCAAHVTLVQE